MYTQQSPLSAPIVPTYSLPFRNNGSRPLPPIPSKSKSVPTSPMRSNNRPEVSYRNLLDSTTLEVGFNHTCLEGLTDDLLYSPVDAFAQSCWETLFPEHNSAKPPISPQTPAYDPPSYTPFPEMYNIPEGSKSAATVRALSCHESYLEMTPEESDDGGDLGSSHSGGCFWDDSDDSGEYDEASSGDDGDSDDFSTYFVQNDVNKNHPIIDFDFPDDPLSPDTSSGVWKPSFITWQTTLPRHMAVAVDLRDTRLNDNKQHKKTSRIAALRAKLPSIRTSTKQSTASDIWL